MYKTLLLCVVLVVCSCARRGNVGTHVRVDENRVLVVDGRRVFHVGFDLGPPVGGVTPGGVPALEELAEAGGTFLQTGPKGGVWDEKGMEEEQRWMDGAARYGLYCWPRLAQVARLDAAHPEREAKLREIVARFKDHPAMGVWNSEDEPEWGKVPVEELKRAYDLIHQLDPNHPVSINQAPRGTVESLRAYEPAYDITGMDVYPVSYPMGLHSILPNKSISMVGDYTRMMREVTRKPVWIYLQVAWSGVLKPGRTLRYPTFGQERFMTYEAIINGATGIIYFGGQQTRDVEDTKLGWTWSFWDRVLKPIVKEIGSHSVLYPALTAGESSVKLNVSGTGMEYSLRRVGERFYLMACKRDGPEEVVTFSNLPAGVKRADVLYEAGRGVPVVKGGMTDWFAPYDVHVYELK